MPFILQVEKVFPGAVKRIEFILHVVINIDAVSQIGSLLAMPRELGWMLLTDNLQRYLQCTQLIQGSSKRFYTHTHTHK